MTDNAHDRRTLEQRLKWIADWSEPGIDLADAGTAREALDRIKSQAIRIRELEAERQRLITENNVLTNERDAIKAEVARLRVAPVDAHKPTPTAVADSAAANPVVNGGARGEVGE